MVFRTLNLLKSRKAQFFVLSIVVVIGILYFLSRWLEPSNIIDTSSVVLMDEPFIFNNIKEKAVETTQNSKSCTELKYNLEEYRVFAENYAFKKGELALHYQFISPCYDNPPTPAVVEFVLNLSSSKMKLGSTFYAGWTPS
jgi:hypothetical protein